MACATDTIRLTVLSSQELDEANFDRLLRWLAPTPWQAGEKYEVIRRGLIQYFVWRGFSYEAEALADETINRVTEKVGFLAETYEGAPTLYFYGVAKNVLREAQRKQHQAAHIAPPESLAEDTDREDREERLEALERCLSRLDKDDRYLLTEYYRLTGARRNDARQALAKKLGLKQTALRMRVHRLKARLRRCIEKALAS